MGDDVRKPMTLKRRFARDFRKLGIKYFGGVKGNCLCTNVSGNRFPAVVFFFDEECKYVRFYFVERLQFTYGFAAVNLGSWFKFCERQGMKNKWWYKRYVSDSQTEFNHSRKVRRKRKVGQVSVRLVTASEKISRRQMGKNVVAQSGRNSVIENRDAVLA